MKKVCISMILTLSLGPAVALAESADAEAFSRIQPAVEFLLMSSDLKIDSPDIDPPDIDPPKTSWVKKKIITPKSGTYSIEERPHLKFKKLTGDITSFVVRLDGKDITKKINKCRQEKGGGKSVCKKFRWKKWGAGSHTLQVKVKFADGRKFKDKVKLRLK